MKLVSIGFGCVVAAERIVAVVSPDSSPVKRIIQEAREGAYLIDATASTSSSAPCLPIKSP